MTSSEEYTRERPMRIKVPVQYDGAMPKEEKLTR